MAMRRPVLVVAGVIVKDGKVVLRVEPMHRAMKWQNFEGEPAGAEED